MLLICVFLTSCIQMLQDDEISYLDVKDISDQTSNAVSWCPLIYEYDDPSNSFYNPEYPHLMKIAFQRYLNKEAAIYNSVKSIYELYSFSNETLLMIAAYTNDFDLVDFLLSINVDINQRTKRPYIGIVDDYNFMMAMSINEKVWSGETALHYAARGGNTEMYQYLIKHGADESIENIQGETAMEVFMKKRFFKKQKTIK